MKERFYLKISKNSTHKKKEIYRKLFTQKEHYTCTVTYLLPMAYH